MANGQNDGVVTDDTKYWVMVIRRKPNLIGLLVSTKQEIPTRDRSMTDEEMADKIGSDNAEILRPLNWQMTTAEILKHSMVELLDKYEVAGWNVLYTRDDLKAAGLL